eukprot:539593-Alexandrium_andersonii.AAC.1
MNCESVTEPIREEGEAKTEPHAPHVVVGIATDDRLPMLDALLTWATPGAAWRIGEGLREVDMGAAVA